MLLTLRPAGFFLLLSHPIHFPEGRVAGAEMAFSRVSVGSAAGVSRDCYKECHGLGGG